MKSASVAVDVGIGGLAVLVAIVVLVEHLRLVRVDVLVVDAAVEQTGVLRADGKADRSRWRAGQTKLRRMCRSTDCMKAWPLLSSRLNRLVRQKPISRLPARDRSSMIFASAGVGGLCGDGG